MAIKVAIIGCGGMAGGHLNSYLRIWETVPGKVDLTAIARQIHPMAGAGV